MAEVKLYLRYQSISLTCKLSAFYYLSSFVYSYSSARSSSGLVDRLNAEFSSNFNVYEGMLSKHSLQRY